jgi:hypothetical protein
MKKMLLQMISGFLQLESAIVITSIPTENQIFMDCLDAHLYEIEYNIY